MTLVPQTCGSVDPQSSPEGSEQPCLQCVKGEGGSTPQKPWSKHRKEMENSNRRMRTASSYVRPRKAAPRILRQLIPVDALDVPL